MEMQIVLSHLWHFSFFPFWQHWVSVAARGLSSVAVSGSYSSLWCTSSFLWWILLLGTTGSRCMGFNSCGVGSRVHAQELRHTGVAALQHVESFQARDWTCVPCIGSEFLSTVPLGKSITFLCLSFTSDEKILLIFLFFFFFGSLPLLVMPVSLSPYSQTLPISVPALTTFIRL